ncbi:MAG: hypothetical protein H6617_06885 [Bdellovibrionaceae bacterium]|nr:hypothetical protein [Bdellovibrionales bacterium]MCB9254391.1 hypothetical protein [Pseudobdellovibrionaceae bacterium]
MKWIKKIFGSGTAIVLCEDHVPDRETFSEKLDEVGKYFKFAKVADLVKGLREGNLSNQAAICLENPRKSTFLNAVPELVARNIPFTLFLNVDCIGLNRLPIQEEIAIYKGHYADALAADTTPDDLSWVSPQDAEARLDSWRKNVGPFPIEAQDPTRYFATWGQILEIPPQLVEYGMHLSTKPEGKLVLRHEEALDFIKIQTKQAVRHAFSAYTVSAFTEDLKKLELDAVVCRQSEGELSLQTNVFDIPIWKLEA